MKKVNDHDEQILKKISDELLLKVADKPQLVNLNEDFMFNRKLVYDLPDKEKMRVGRRNKQNPD